MNRGCFYVRERENFITLQSVYGFEFLYKSAEQSAAAAKVTGSIPCEFPLYQELRVEQD